MLKFTDQELTAIRQFNLMPENIDETGYDNLPLDLYHSIRKKFWPDDPWDGFDALSIEDVAIWVLTTYLTRVQVEKMSGVEIIEFLQDWKYYFGFRKHEGDGDLYRHLALEAFDGKLVLCDINKEIYYREVDN